MPDHLNDHDRRSYDLEIAALKTEVTDLKDDIKDLRIDIKGLVEAWNTAKGMTSFVKWLSGVVVACVTVYAIATGKKP